jgi:hypothetical protein
MPPKVPAGAAAAAAAEDESSSSSEDEKGEAGTQSKQSKLERKSRKAVAKLGLKPITGVTRVTLRRQKSYQVSRASVFLAHGYVQFSSSATISLTLSHSSSSLPPTSINPLSVTPM